MAVVVVFLRWPRRYRPRLTTGCPHFLRPVVVGGGRVVGGGGGGARGARSRRCVAAQRSCAGSGSLPRAGAQLPVDCVFIRKKHVK